MKKILIMFALLGIIAVGTVSAQNGPEIEFDRTYQGDSPTDTLTSVIQHPDGGYTLGGDTLIRVDSSGNVQFKTSEHGGKGKNIVDVIRTNDGGYAAVGSAKSIYGEDILFAKVNSQGDVEFDRQYSFADRSSDYSDSLIQTSDGDYVITGSTTTDRICTPVGAGRCPAIAILKIGMDGEVIYMKNHTVDGTTSSQPSSIVETSDGGYAIAGVAETVQRSSSSPPGSTNMLLMKVDSQGEVEFARMYGGDDADSANSLIQTSDGGYALVGTTKSYGGYDTDAFFVKTDSQGDLEFKKVFGGNDPHSDVAGSVTQTEDGGYAIAGSTESFGSRGDGDMWLIKLDSSGNGQFSRTYGGHKDDGAGIIKQSQDGGYVLGGTTNSYGRPNSPFSMWLVKTEKWSGSGTNDIQGEGGTEQTENRKNTREYEAEEEPSDETRNNQESQSADGQNEGMSGFGILVTIVALLGAGRLTNKFRKQK